MCCTPTTCIYISFFDSLYEQLPLGCSKGEELRKCITRLPLSSRHAVGNAGVRAKAAQCEIEVDETEKKCFIQRTK